MATPIEELNKLVEQLSPDRQRRVLEFAQGLAQTQRVILSLPKTPLPPGTSGRALLAALQNTKLSAEDVDAMERALEDCERIEPDEY
jgi:hypothetical protein